MSKSGFRVLEDCSDSSSFSGSDSWYSDFIFEDRSDFIVEEDFFSEMNSLSLPPFILLFVPSLLPLSSLFFDFITDIPIVIFDSTTDRFSYVIVAVTKMALVAK